MTPSRFAILTAAMLSVLLPVTVAQAQEASSQQQQPPAPTPTPGQQPSGELVVDVTGGTSAPLGIAIPAMPTAAATDTPVQNQEDGDSDMPSNWDYYEGDGDYQDTNWNERDVQYEERRDVPGLRQRAL